MSADRPYNMGTENPNFPHQHIFHLSDPSSGQYLIWFFNLKLFWFFRLLRLGLCSVCGSSDFCRSIFKHLHFCPKVPYNSSQGKTDNKNENSVVFNNIHRTSCRLFYSHDKYSVMIMSLTII